MMFDPQGCVVIVMLTRLQDNGLQMCHRYWPEEGSEQYHIFEVSQSSLLTSLLSLYSLYVLHNVDTGYWLEFPIEM